METVQTVEIQTHNGSTQSYCRTKPWQCIRQRG